MMEEFPGLRLLGDYDPRIVDLYDEDNPDGPDHGYFRSLADQIGAGATILDVGCGTGILTVTFAKPGRIVVGVDPSPSMVAYARHRRGADRVTWIEGDTRTVNEHVFDLIVMSGNVAQHIPDPQWERTLADLRHLANDGALLAFESRNPAARAWVGWNQRAPTTRETVHGPLRRWCEATAHDRGHVSLRFYKHFEATGEVVVQEELLTFRGRNVLSRQLAHAGFEVAAIWGDWKRTPFDGSQPIMVFEARAAKERHA